MSIQLPIVYRDGSAVIAMFRVAPERAESCLPPALEPWRMFGKALAVFAGFEYRNSTVGIYNEVGLGILAKRRGTRPSRMRYALDMTAQDEQGLWVANLPVTTEAAKDAGIEVWGYPKYVTTISTSFRDDGTTVRLGDELQITASRLSGVRSKLIPLVTLTSKNARMLRTVIAPECRAVWGGPGSARLEILGTGPTAQTARALDLEHAAVLATMRTDTFRATLPEGKDVGAA